MKNIIKKVVNSDMVIIVIMMTALLYCVIAGDYTAFDYKAIVVCLVVCGCVKVVNKIYNTVMEED